MSDDFVRVAKVQITQRKYPDAVRICRRGLLGDPGHLEGRLVLGMALMAMRRYGEVRAEMALALKTAPTHPVALRLQGEAYLKEGDLPKAEASLKKALHAAPADVVTRELLLEFDEAGRGQTEETTTVERWFDGGRAGKPQQDLGAEDTTVRGESMDDFEQGVETRVVDADTADKLRREAGLFDDVTVTAPSGSVPLPSAPPAAERPGTARPTMRMRGDPEMTPVPAPFPRDLPPEKTMQLDDAEVVVEDGQVVGEDDVLSDDDMDDLVVDETSEVTDAAKATVTIPKPTIRTGPPAGMRAPAPAARPASAPPPAAPPPAARPRMPSSVGMPSASAPGGARPSAPPPAARPRPSSIGMPAVAAPAAAARPSAPPPAARKQTLLGMQAVSAVAPRASAPPPARPSAPAPAARPSAPAPPRSAPAPAEKPKLAQPLPDLDDLGYDDDEPATMIKDRVGDLAGLAAIALEEPVAEPAPIGKTMRPGGLRASAAPPLPAAGVVHAPPPRAAPPVVVSSQAPDRRFDPTPPPRSAVAMEAPSLPPPPPDADPFGRVAIPDSRYKGPAPILAAPSGGRRKSSTAVFIVAGIAGGVVLLAAGIVAMTSWSRGKARDEKVAEAARADASGSEGDLRAALAALEEVLDSDETVEAKAAVARGAAWLAVEYEDAAAVTRAEALLADPGVAALAGGVEARALLLLRAGRAADAQRGLDSLPSPNARALHAKGLVAAVRGELDVAARALGAAATAAPSDVRISAMLAEVLYRLGDHAGANARLTAIDPTGARSRIRLARARALAFAGRDADARADADALLAMTPPASATERSWAELIRGRALRSEDPAGANAAADRSEQGRRAWDVDFATTRARLLLDLGRPREARAEAERAAAATPDRPEVRLLVAEAALRSGDLEAAASALASVPPLSEAAALAGEVALARGDLPGAKARFEEASRDAALASRAKLGLARVAVAEGRIRDAGTLLETVPAGTAGATVLRAEVLFALGETDDARDALAAAGAEPGARVAAARLDAWTGRVAPATESLRALVGATPANVSARVALADLLIQAGDVPAASEQIEAARSLAPASADVQLAIALLACVEGRANDAEQAIGAAQQAGAPPTAISRARGRLLLARQKGREAVDALRDALRGSPRDPWIHVWTGQAHLLGEASGEAMDAFARALRIDSRMPEAHVGMALAGLLSGSFAAVAEGLERAERSLSDHPRGDKLRAQILYVRGRFHWENGNYDEAAGRLRDATGKDPALAEAFAFLGYAIVDGRGDHAGACAAFARYVELAPDGPEAGEVRRMSRTCR